LSQDETTSRGGASPSGATEAVDASLSYREVFNATGDALFVHHETGLVLDVNPAMCAMFGCSREQALALPPRAFCLGVSPYSEGDGAARLADALRDGATSFEWRSRRLDGTLFWSQVALRRAEFGGRRFVIASVRDISRQTEAEEALRASEERNRAFASIAIEGIMIHEEGVVIDANMAFARMAGCSDPSELVGRDRLEVVPLTPESRQRILDHQSSHDIEPFDIELVRTDGTLLHVETLGRDATYLGRSVRLVYMRDITERRRAEQALRQSEERFRHLFEAGPDAMFVHDERGALLDANRATCESLGYAREELMNLTLPDIAKGHGPEALKELFTAIREAGQLDLEGIHQRRDGTRFPVDVRVTLFDSARGSLYFAAARDATARRRSEAERATLEESLRHAQKLESIGRLAGGVAHDFNNLLTAISGNVSLALSDLRPSNPLHDLLREVDKAADSAARLTRHLLAFSRKQVIDPKVINVNDLVQQLQRMLQRLLGEDVVLEVVLAPNLASVRADPGQLEQVLVNLAVNSRDAMPDGGKLTIETSNVHLDEQRCRLREGVDPGPYVRLAVSDHGTGLTDDVRAHLFEPFFTTKETGKGTGLGLAMVYGAVRQNRGDIEVDSTLGRGTTFTIYLPALAAAADPIATAQRPDLPRGDETVALVEDDDAVRGMAVRLLRRQGYNVRAYPNGIEALAAFEAALARSPAEAPPRLLITDVVMPGMSGSVLAEKVRVLLPGVRVLFTSGYTEDSVTHQGTIEQGIEFLPKPYTLSTLATRVREVLDGAPG
jgi:PAS domain S-box-containing protein